MALKLAQLPAIAQPRCEDCPFAKDGKPQHEPVLGTCIKKPKGLLVGESPGGEEVEQGEVFKGRTGKWLDLKLRQSGLDRGDMAIVNGIGCQPPKGMKTDTNMGQAAHACRPLFLHQIQPYVVAKTPVLAMGKWATFAVAGRAIAVETGRGFLRDFPGGATGIVTWHPTYAAFYNPWKNGEFTVDLDRFRRLIEGKLERPPTVNIHVTVADVLALLRTPYARAQGIDVDLETRAPAGRPAHEGKDPTRAEIKCISFGTPDHAVVYWWGSNIAVQRTYIRVLEDPNILKGWHNGWFFDGRVLRRAGVNPVNVIDTRDMRRALSSTSRLSLRHLVSVYSDFAPWKETEDEK